MRTLKITTKDGIFYARESNGKYFPISGGWNFVPSPDAKIEEIETIPEELKHGTVSIDGEYFITEAFWNQNNLWNGWMQPFIPVENIGIFNDGYSITKTEEGYLYKSEHTEYEAILDLVTIAGNQYLHINTGLCFSRHEEETED